MRIDIEQKHCRLVTDHDAHGWNGFPMNFAQPWEFRCPGRYTPSLHRAPHPSPAQPSDPFAGIDENTEYDATRPGAS